MGVYIPKMKMPETCGGCAFFEMPHQDYPYCRLTNNDIYEWGKKQKDCPLIELPPHGRLIDADKLKSDAYLEHDCIHKMMVFGGQMVYTESAIDNAPTIIEAEEEE